MRGLFLAVLLASAAAARDAQVPGRPAQRAREALDALPPQARVELRRMYLRYREEVSRRLEQGWEAGTLSDAVIEDLGEPFQPARLLEDAEKSRRQELADLTEQLSKAPQDAPESGALRRKVEAAKAAAAGAGRKNTREKGICRDWSDDVWSTLTALKPERWTIDDRRRRARPFHTAAVACAPEDEPTICLAFDPWAEGKPEVFAFPAWDDNEPGGRLPPDYFLHELPEKVP